MQSDAIMLVMLFDFTRFGTPTFVFLSGLLLFYNNNGTLSYWPFIQKRLYRGRLHFKNVLDLSRSRQDSLGQLIPSLFQNPDGLE